MMSTLVLDKMIHKCKVICRYSYSQRNYNVRNPFGPCSHQSPTCDLMWESLTLDTDIIGSTVVMAMIPNVTTAMLCCWSRFQFTSLTNTLKQACVWSIQTFWQTKLNKRVERKNRKLYKQKWKIKTGTEIIVNRHATTLKWQVISNILMSVPRCCRNDNK